MPATPILRRQLGLTLVELMVGMTLGLVLVAGLVTWFVNSSISSSELDKSIRQYENGRFAVELLVEDINHAGFFADVLSVAGEPDYVSASVCETAVANLGWRPAQGASAATAPMPVTGLSSGDLDAMACIPNHKANTPGIAIRRLDTRSPTPDVAVAGTVYVQSSHCASSTATFVIAAAQDPPNGVFALQNHDCATPAPLRRHLSRVYYLASCNECGIDTTPTLKRAELANGVVTITPLVEGVEDIAFEYGFDTAKLGDETQFDGIPDEYRLGLSGTVGANNNDWRNVVAVRTYLLTRAIERTPGYADSRIFSMGLAGTRGAFTDGFKRRSYVITARLHNVAGRREGP